MSGERRDADLRWRPTHDAAAVTALDAWQVCDVTGWSEVSPETRGKRSKCWVASPDGVRWLRKEPWISRPFELAVETFALRLTRASGLPAPESHPCTWDAPDGRKRGIIVRAFTDVLSGGDTTEGAQLQDGAALLAERDPAYEPESHPMHSLARVKAALEHLESRHPGAVLSGPFMQLMAFDLWVGNTDRHQHNWAILRDGDEVRLAPLYDPAACLGVELKDGHKLLDPKRRIPLEVTRYRDGAPSGFGDETRLIKLAAVAQQLRAWPGWTDNVMARVATFRRVMDTHVGPFLQSIPDDWLPQAHKELAELLLRERLSWCASQHLNQTTP